MNNRLIRLNSFAFKMVEQMYLETTSKHMKGRKVFWNSQHGFLKKKSCLIKLIDFYNEITISMDNSRAVDISCLCLS